MSITGSDAARVSSSVPDDARASVRPGENASGGPGAVEADGAGTDVLRGGQGVPVEVKLLAIVAIAAGAVFRFVAPSPLWLDEALSVNIASLSPTEILEALRHDGHPPLYYLLLHYWIGIFGSDASVVRGLSAVIGLLALPVAWVAGRRKGGPVLAWVFVALMALSPYAVRYGNETRMYSLVMLLVLVGYLLVDSALREASVGLGRLVAIGVVSGLLPLTHYWSLWLLGAVGLLLAWFIWRRAGTPVAMAARRVLVAMVAGFVLLFLWWLPSMLYQSAHTGTPWSNPFRPTVSVSIALFDFGAAISNYADATLVVIIVSALFLLGLFGRGVAATHIDIDLRTNREYYYEAVVIGITLAIGLVVGLISSSTFASRYGAVVFPLYLFIAAGGVMRFVSRPVRAGALAVVLLLFGGGSLYESFHFQRSQSRVVAQAISDAHPRPGDLVVYCPDQLGPAYSREMPGGLQQVVFPTLAPPQRVDWVDYASRNAAADPVRVADDVLARAGPEHAVFVVWAGTYKTFEGKCEAFVNAISSKRPSSATLVESEGLKYFEHANLSYFAPLAR